MNMDELRQLCVDNFPHSEVRKILMDNFESIINELRKTNIKSEIWVDGSFLTRKPDPVDIDLILKMNSDVYETLNERQKSLLDDLVRCEYKDEYGFHFRHFQDYPENHQEHELGLWLNSYWIKQFGYSRNEEVKGIARIYI